MLDFHTHILPGMDDGSASVDESCAMLKAEADQGIRKVVLTPHFYPDSDSPAGFLERRRASAKQLTDVLQDKKQLPQLMLGAETAFFRGISRMDDVQRLCIGDTNALLIEMPFAPWNERMLEELYKLREHRGVQPVLAHVERYLHMQPHGMVHELCAGGILLQANASFFLERGTSRLAMKMLKKQQIHLMGSDCHNMKTRKPNMGEALKRIADKLGEDALGYLAYMQDLVLEEL